MFDWPFLMIERFATADSRRTTRVAELAPHWLIRKVARAKLVRTLQHVWRNSPYQRERWRDAGIRRGDLGAPDVLRHIPFCNPKELAATPEAFYCVPPDQFTDVLTTSGTSGTSKRIYFTEEDVEHQTNMMAASFRRLPGASRMMVVFSPTYRPASTPDAFVKRGSQKAGMFGLVASPHWPLSTHVEIIRDYHIDTIIATPTGVHKGTLEAGGNVRALGIKYFLLSAEPWSEDLRTLIEDAWGAKALDAYGCNESGGGIASECIAQDGLHVSETDFWVEIVDHETGEPVEDGTEGEVVFTTLSRRGMPLVRYRIGDIASFRVDEGRCACGLSLRKLSRIRGRADNVIILAGGFKIYPDEFDHAILAVPGVTDYQLIIEKDAHRNRLSLVVESDLDGDELATTMTQALRKMKQVVDGVDVYDILTLGSFESVPRGSLSEGRNKTPRVLDRRP